LQTCEIVKVAVETGRAIVWSVAVNGKIGIGCEEGVGADEGLLGVQADICEGWR
jgi:hypothetical protein